MKVLPGVTILNTMSAGVVLPTPFANLDTACFQFGFIVSLGSKTTKFECLKVSLILGAFVTSFRVCWSSGLQYRYPWCLSRFGVCQLFRTLLSTVNCIFSYSHNSPCRFNWIKKSHSKTTSRTTIDLRSPTWEVEVSSLASWNQYDPVAPEVTNGPSWWWVYLPRVSGVEDIRFQGIPVAYDWTKSGLHRQWSTMRRGWRILREYEKRCANKMSKRSTKQAHCPCLHKKKNKWQLQASDSYLHRL